MTQTCSKMFIGGLNWDTTDGTGLRTVFHSMSSTKLACYTRIAQKILLPVWQSRRLHHHAGLHWPLQMFCVSYFRRPGVGQCSYGARALPGWKDCAFGLPCQDTTCSLYFNRSIPSEPFLGRSISGLQNYSLAVSQEVSLQNLCGNFSRSLVKLSIQRSCLIARRVAARVLASSPSRTLTSPPSLDSETLRSTESWWVLTSSRHRVLFAYPVVD